ncbi:three-Cys-motif partner protein TcmP [candidate division KSB1 bacterium]|nr:three-Cys-motif partner protein TcmP [candidate division KSB1 bacterium]
MRRIGAFGSFDIGTAPSLGSPLIGIKALHDLATNKRNTGCDIQSKSLLIEKDAQTFKSLQTAITQYAPDKGNISLIEGEFADKIDAIQQFCQNYFSLILIDPFGPSSVPFWAVARVVAQKFTDVIMHFPSNAILRMSGHGADEPTNRISQERVKWLDDFFGSPDWKKIMQEAKEHETFRRDQVKQQIRIEETGQTEMFAVEKDEPKFLVNIAELAEQLFQKFKNKTVTREEIYYNAIFIEHVLKTDIDKALTHLKKAKRIEPQTVKPSLKQRLKFR